MKDPIEWLDDENNAPLQQAMEPVGTYGFPAKDTNIEIRPIYHIQKIRQGLKKSSLDSLMRKSNLSLFEMANILDITDRTIRRYAADDLLSRSLSERILEIAALYSHGEDVFGSAASFQQWMAADVPAIGHRQPKSMLDTSIGIQLIHDELGRIEHGVFA